MFLKVAKKTSAWFCVVLGCLFLNSCFEVAQEFTLNPDGTGKVVIESAFPNISMNGDAEQSDEALKKAVSEFIKNTKGVEVWRDVTYSWADDGRIEFKGTAYFSDIAKLDFHNQGTMVFGWSADGGTGELTADFKKSDNPGKPKEVAKDPEARKKEMLAERQKFQQSKPMLSGFMTGLKHKAMFILPGNSGDTVNFKEEAGGKLGIEVTGEKLLEAMEKLLGDDKWLMANSFDPQQGPSDIESMSEVLFGEKGAVKAGRTGLGEPLFDYAAEVAAARENFAKLQEEFTGPIAPPAAGEAMKSLAIVGVQMSEEVDEKIGLRPFNSEPGLSLCFLGEFPGSVLAVSEIMLETAVGSDGSDLLPETEWDRKAGFPRLSETNTAVMFELKLEMPKPEVKSFRKLSGNIQYTVSGGEKEMDLGFSALKTGEKGKEFEAEIVEIKDGWKKDGSKEIEINLALDSDTVKSLVLVDGAKRKELEKNGHSSFGNGPTTFTFESEDGFPETAKLLVLMHDGIKIFDVPFKMENISLQGKALKGE